MNVTVSVCDIVVQIIVIMILVEGCGGVVGTHVTLWLTDRGRVVTSV